MQNLNDRLAVYIDAVRSREAEINSLKQERSIILGHIKNSPFEALAMDAVGIRLE